MSRPAVARFLPHVFGAILLIAILVCSGGCATVAHGAWQDVAVTSEPPGADVFVNDQPVGTAPLTVSLKRRDNHIVLRFAKDGFADVRVPLNRTTSAMVAGDFAISFNPFAAQGLDSPSRWPLLISEALGITLGIDILTGAAYKLPARVRAILSPTR